MVLRLGLAVRLGLRLAVGRVFVRAVVAGRLQPAVWATAVEAPTAADLRWVDQVNSRSETPAIRQADVGSPRSFSAPRLAARCGTWLMLGATLLALVYLIDPTGECWGANSVAPLKYLPAEVAVIAQGLFLLDRKP